MAGWIGPTDPQGAVDYRMCDHVTPTCARIDTVQIDTVMMTRGRVLRVSGECHVATAKLDESIRSATHTFAATNADARAGAVIHNTVRSDALLSYHT